MALAVALACGCGEAVAPADPSELAELRAAADRLAVAELMTRYAYGIDAQDRQMLASVFAPDAVAEYVAVGPSPFVLDERLEGFEAIYGWLSRVLGGREPGFPRHYMANPLVELEGDRARLRVYQHNWNISSGGVYTVEAVRTSDGWRIARLHLDERTFDPERVQISPEIQRAPPPPSPAP
jgi:hypothetical protein